MTLDQLEAFKAIVTHGTFTKAAAVLHKAQPALSVLIKNLEAECNFQLFDRSSYRPVLTDEGRLFHEETVEVLAGVNALKVLARRLAGEEEPVLRLMVDEVCPLSVLLPTLKQIDERYATHLMVSNEIMDGAMERLSKDEAALAITLQSPLPTELMEYFHFMTVPLVAVAHRDHPVSAHPGPLSTFTMKAYNQIILAGGSSSGRQSLNVLQGGKKWVVSDISSKKDIILAGLGWGGLPRYFVTEELTSGELVALDVEGFETDGYHLMAVRRKDRPHGIVSEALWAALQALARELDGYARLA